jgi:hypothetical protein
MWHDDRREQVSFIPKQFATQGRRLRLHDEEGWSVAEVWGDRPAADVLAHERDYMKHRQATDA